MVKNRLSFLFYLTCVSCIFKKESSEGLKSSGHWYGLHVFVSIEGQASGG